MNITEVLIISILKQAEAITCKNLRAECGGEIIIRFEDDTDTTISIYYTPYKDILSIGTIQNGTYKLSDDLTHASRRDPDTFRKYLTLAVGCLELEHEIENMVEIEEE